MARCSLGWSLVAVGVVALAGPAGAAATPGASDTMAASDRVPAVDRLRAQRPDRDRVAHVDHLELVRGAAHLTLERGDLALCAPVEGRVWAGVFTGEGAFSFTPPTSFERAQLDRFFQTPQLERRVGAVVLVFADSTEDELGRRLAFAPSTVPAQAAEPLAMCLDALRPGILRPFLDRARTGYFLAYLVCEPDERLFFEIDPAQFEEEILWRVARGPFLTVQSLREREIVCQFPHDGQYDSAAVGTERPDLVVSGYRLDCSISSGLQFSAVAELSCRAEVDGARWIPFELFEGLDVDSAAWAGSGPASFLRERGGSGLWVQAPAPSVRGEERTLRVTYHGPLIRSVGEWMLLDSWTDWYPQPRAGGESTFDLTFHAPSGFLLTSVGERLSRETRGKIATSRWAVRRPARNATFVLGPFREKPLDLLGAPPVRALEFQGRPEKITWRGEGFTLTEGSGLAPWVVQDAARCAGFFQQRLGPAPMPGLVVAQIPTVGVGEAFPGLINIPETPFAGPTAAAEDEVFRSHEVAHQWWGYGLDGRTYHDHWLTEGFANFSALWYLQAGLGRSPDYFAVLHHWREELIDDRRTRPEGGRQAGPVWLGTRNASRSRPGDFRLVDYEKGAWVLQMLRSMLLDLETMDDSRFTALMQDFYRSYAGRHASTDDFQRLAEAHAGADLGWFFDQWVYGTGLPTYRFATRKDRLEDGRYHVRCRVEQSGVPPDFRMPVTIRVDFGKDKFAWVRREVAGPVTEFDLPPLPMYPTRIILNDLESVLCEVVDVNW